MNTIIRTAAIAASSLLLASAPALAASVTNLNFAGGCPADENDPLCNNSGNPSEASVALLLGLDASDVTLLEEDSTDATATGFSITFDSGDYTTGAQSGTWTVTDSSIDYLTFKADGYYILAEVTGTSGVWSTDINDWSPTYTDLVCPAGICNPDARNYAAGDFPLQDLSNVQSFSVVPIPAAVWLFGSGLGLLGWMRRKSIVAS